MIAGRAVPTTLAGLLAVLLTVSCGGGSTSAAPAPSATPSTLPAPSAPTPSPAVPGIPRTAAPADLENALLAPADLPSGYAVGQPGPALSAPSSKLPACKDLVTLLDHAATGSGELARSVSSAGVLLDGGADAPLVQERLDGFDRPLPAIEVVADELLAVNACPQVTLTVPHYGRATFSVAQISIATVGKGSWALRLSAVPAALDGLEVIVAASVVDGVAVHVVTDDVADGAEQTLGDAVDKVHKVITGSGTGGNT